ncbi:MAG: hypothetical protein LWX56_02190 [Ignavibacteria bacterium]|nr:hypothetical protein [Ignavibacteria bacterium]
MPPIVKMIGIADIHRFARITATIGKKSFYLPIGKETHDILIELSDTVQPIRQYRQPIKLK